MGAAWDGIYRIRHREVGMNWCSECDHPFNEPVESDGEARCPYCGSAWFVDHASLADAREDAL